MNHLIFNGKMSNYIQLLEHGKSFFDLTLTEESCFSDIQYAKKLISIWETYYKKLDIACRINMSNLILYSQLRTDIEKKCKDYKLDIKKLKKIKSMSIKTIDIFVNKLEEYGKIIEESSNMLEDCNNRIESFQLLLEESKRNYEFEQVNIYTNSITFFDCIKFNHNDKLSFAKKKTKYIKEKLKESRIIMYDYTIMKAKFEKKSYKQLENTKTKLKELEQKHDI